MHLIWDLMGKFIHESARVVSSQIGDIKVFRNATIVDSKIDSGCSIGDDTNVERCVIGNNVVINRRSYINDSDIGAYTYMGINTTMNFTKIGKFCSLARNVDVGGFDHDYHKVTTMPAFRYAQTKNGGGKLESRTEHKDFCKIGNDVWIAAGAQVLHHQVSTDEVYGDLPLNRPDLFFTEETPIHTSSPYSSSKAAADLLVLAYHRTYGLPVTISRCSNNYGPYHFPEKLIPLMIANALADKPLPVYGEGLNVRDWLYVEDHCKAIDLIIHNGRVGEVYNVGGHNEKKNIDIVKIICKELGKPESLITHVGDRKGHDMRYAIDPTKIHNELGWLPETKFEDGIKKTIQWYLDNREWWETIISGEYQNYYEKMYGNR